jgi:hypothetical protein
VLDERPLARGGGEDGVLGAFERDEEGVSLVVDLSPAVGCELLPQEAVVIGQDSCVLAALRLEQLRRALDVGEKERCHGGARFVHGRNHPARLDLLQVGARTGRIAIFHARPTNRASLAVSREDSSLPPQDLKLRFLGSEKAVPDSPEPRVDAESFPELRGVLLAARFRGRLPGA